MQDEIISDEECEPESRSEPEDDLNQDRQALTDVPPLEISQQPIAYYNPASTPLQANMPPVPHHHSQPPPHILASQAVPAVNGAVHPDELSVLPGKNDL